MVIGPLASLVYLLSSFRLTPILYSPTLKEFGEVKKGLIRYIHPSRRAVRVLRINIYIEEEELST